MIKSVKRYFIILLVCCAVLTGCSSTQISESANGNVTLQATTATFEKDNLRTYIEIYQTKLFYMEIDNNIAEFYVYDFQSAENKKISTISDFALKGTSNTLIDNKLYFYISTYKGSDLENVLYVMDFSTNNMEIVSQNSYSQKLIPLTEYDDQLLALQKNVSGSGTNDSFIESITDSGESKQIALQNSDDTTSNTESQQPLYIDNNGIYLCTIGKEIKDSDVKYYFAKYDSDFNLLEEVDITNLFIDYEITDNIGTFYAFGNFFCITDYSNNTIICKLDKGNISVLLCDTDIEYVKNCSENISSEIFFRRGTNNIYVLDTQTGVMQIQNYDLDNDFSVIRCVLSYDDYLMIVKKPLSQEDNTEYLYLIPQNL